MRFIQIYDPRKGVVAAKLDSGRIYPIAYEQKNVRSMLELVEYATAIDLDLTEVGEELAASEALEVSWEDIQVAPEAGKIRVAIPIHPPEVWAFGVTYKKSAEFRDGDIQSSKGIYDSVYSARRPELFFKGTAPRCTGTHDFIGMRCDSVFTAVEPELAVLVNCRKKVLGYMVGNDVSAWDIERENPLYLPQSKVFKGCCALGPLLVSADEIPNPYDLTIHCQILRQGQIIFSGETSIGMMRRKIEDLIDFLFLANHVPTGTVVLTGTGIIQTEEAALQEGDIVEIGISEIGTLTNTVRRVE